jgi:hypothetical protein
MRIRRLTTVSATALVLALQGCATPSPQPVASSSSSSSSPRPGLGETKLTAIEVCRPVGERAYLDRLRCSDGSTPTHKRVGSFGERNEVPKELSREQQAGLLKQQLSGAALTPGESDYHIVDGYEVSCGAVKRMVYLDMYHCDRAPTSDVPNGFKPREPNP